MFRFATELKNYVMIRINFLGGAKQIKKTPRKHGKEKSPLQGVSLTGKLPMAEWTGFPLGDGLMMI